MDENSPDPFVQWCLSQREEMVENFRLDLAGMRKLLADGVMGGEAEIAEYERGGAPWCITYGFLPDELRGILEGLGLKDIRMAGPGAYARSISWEILRKIMADSAQRQDFLDFCYVYDQNPYVLGMGKDNLFAMGLK